MNKIAYLDGESYEIEAGETLLNFIERQREKGCVPTLCYDDRLEPFGSRRPGKIQTSHSLDRRGRGGGAGRGMAGRGGE